MCVSQKLKDLGSSDFCSFFDYKQTERSPGIRCGNEIKENKVESAWS